MSSFGLGMFPFSFFDQVFVRILVYASSRVSVVI